MTERELDIKNKSIAAITSVGVHVVIFLLLFFVIAWRAPDPPLSEYGTGVELNFGTSDVGSGDIQPETEVGSDGTQQEDPSKSEPKESTPAEVKPDEKEDIQGTEVIDNKKVEPKITPEKPKEKPAEKTLEVKKETEVKPKVNSESVYNPNKKTESDSKSTAGKSGKPGSEGDDKGVTGDKGKPEGAINSSGIYSGKPGTGGGNTGGFSMSGFNGFEWPKVEAPALPDEAYGVYEFMVKVDDQGDVISVTPLQRGLSLEAERKLKEVIQKLIFIPKGSNLPAQSEGKITFRVVSK